jgi:hypothetical protein
MISPAPARSTTASRGCSTRAASTASTTTSARKACRTCWRCASATPCSSRLWNARHIEQVQITVAETVGLEGRGGYYDESGAMRDMVQNHLLQLLCLTAMEPPSQFDPSAVRNEKIKVLRSLRPIQGADIATHSVAGQYSAGAVTASPCPATGTNSASRAAPRPSSACAPTSTTGAGRACPSTCAPASACRAAAARSTCSSAPCRTRSSPAAARRCSPMRW